MQFTFKEADLGDIRLAYIERGRGEPVVFVHGSGATDARTWGAQIESFDARYRVIAYSRRYHYPNPWSGDGSEINDIACHAADLAALITTLRLGRVHLVGSSFGADIALRFAVDHPDMLRTLTIAEPGLFHWLVTLPGGAEYHEKFAEAIRPAKEALRSGNLESGARLWIDSFMESGTFERLPPATRDRIMVNARHIGFEPETVSELQNGVSRDEVAAIQTPLLLLRGDGSAPMFHLIMDELARIRPQAQNATIKQADHLLHAMNPGDFNTTVAAFLAGGNR